MKMPRIGGIWKVLNRSTSALVPILALLLTVLTIMSTHRHDRLSVIPKLSFVWETGSGEVVGLWVENSGTGPAVIKNFTPSPSSFPPELADKRIFKDHADFRGFFRTYFLKQGGRIGLRTGKRGELDDPIDVEGLIQGGLLVTIEYCSVYGECWK